MSVEKDIEPIINEKHIQLIGEIIGIDAQRLVDRYAGLQGCDKVPLANYQYNLRRKSIKIQGDFLIYTNILVRVWCDRKGQPSCRGCYLNTNIPRRLRENGEIKLSQ